MNKIPLQLAFRMAIKSLFKRRTLKLIPALEPLECKNSPRYIVSLTSYGKRLAKTAPYAIVTLLDQSVKPDKVILWVANEDRENVPQKIMGKLAEKGLEVRCCDDIMSYKKLVPALEEFPDDYIITADDDIFYPKDWLEQLLAEHGKAPKKIICHRAHGIRVDENHNLLPYREWDHCIEPGAGFSGSRERPAPRPRLGTFPTGVAGALYPPRSLYKDVANRDLFMKLAPKADDVWFWAMAVINREYFGEESPYIVIENSGTRDLLYVDILQQFDGSALRHYNKSRGGNDIQLRAVIERYPQIKEMLGKIEPSVKKTPSIF